MEAWREELYHWGVKGMKWGKRKKLSDQEAAARAYESASKNSSALTADYSKRASSGSLWNKTVRAERAADTARGNVIAKNKRYTSTTTKYGDGRRDRYGIDLAPKLKTAKAVKRANKKVSRKVKSYNRRHKAKTFIKNLFAKAKSK